MPTEVKVLCALLVAVFGLLALSLLGAVYTHVEGWRFTGDLLHAVEDRYDVPGIHDCWGIQRHRMECGR